MQQESKVFVGLDMSKLKISVALAEAGREGAVRFLGDIANTPEAVRRLVMKLAGRYRRLAVCYEAGPTGYGLHRRVAALGHDCAVIAPSLIPKRPVDRVKTNGRDAMTLARLHRAGKLTRIWVPDLGHELRLARIFAGRAAWTTAHVRWPCEQSFEDPAQHLVLREYRQAIEDAETRLERLTGQVAWCLSNVRPARASPGTAPASSEPGQIGCPGRKSRRVSSVGVYPLDVW